MTKKVTGRRPAPAWTGGDRYDREAEKKIGNTKYFGGEWRRCPKCKTGDTAASRTIGPTRNMAYILQWRKCRNPICGHPFKAAKPN